MDGVTQAVIVGVGAIVVIVGGIAAIEAIRRKKEDKSGFQEFIEQGARHSHPELMEAFNGRPKVEKDQKYTLIDIGTFHVIDGDVYACDPSFVREHPVEPIDEKLPIGEHAVDALIFEDRGDQRVAALRVRFTDEEVDHLEVAWTASWRLRAKQVRELPSVGVDSGTAAIFSAQSLANFQIDERDEGEFVPGEANVNPYLSGNPSHLYKETRYDDGSNLYIMYSGLGDGAYACFLGKTKNDTTSCLIIDFGFFEEPTRI